MSTTYTTEAGNLWVWTLGSEKDLWVRQRDRHRCFAEETDTDAVETVDANSPVGPWFRLAEAMGLKGQVMLVSNGSLHVLLHDGERVRLFAPEDGFLKLPLTVVPALLDDEVDAVEAILAAVEAPSEAPRTIRISAEQAKAAAVAERERRASLTAAAVEAPPRFDSVEGYKASVEKLRADEDPEIRAIAGLPALPHPAIARIDAQLDRYLTRLEPQRGGDTSRPCGHDERTSIATSFRELTTARKALL